MRGYAYLEVFTTVLWFVVDGMRSLGISPWFLLPLPLGVAAFFYWALFMDPPATADIEPGVAPPPVSALPVSRTALAKLPSSQQKHRRRGKKRRRRRGG